MEEVAAANNIEELTLEIAYSTEWDEFWSYVGNKKQQRWTWYIVERKTGVIVAWENGKRADKVLKTLLKSVEKIPIKYAFSDDWKAYEKLFPKHYSHFVGKDNTWKIERKNLNFRTHIKRLQRRTICFSKNELIHDNVIGTYIEKHYYKQGLFSQATQEKRA